MKLYKYVSPDRVDILENNKIRFTQPSEWNDPFDMKLSVDKEITEYDEFGVLTKDNLIMYGQVISDLNYLGLSLTEDKNNLLMWAHYADYHKGFILEFDTKSRFFEKNEKTMLVKINYDSKRPSMLSAQESLDFQYDLEYRHKNHEEVVKIHFTKSGDWYYENEWRLIKQISALKTVDDKIMNLEDDQNYILETLYKGLAGEKYSFQHIFLCDLIDNPITGIYFGVNMDSSTKDRILDAIKESNNIDIYTSEIDPIDYKTNYKPANIKMP